MPIRPDLKRYYGHMWRREIRMRALARARHRCERCAKPNSKRSPKTKRWELVETVSGIQFGKPVMFWRQVWRGQWSPWRSNEGIITTDLYVKSLGWRVRRIRVVLTVAHLNHRSGDDRDENLMAMCQWCHLVYDLGQHAETRAQRKDQGRPLLRASA